MSEHETRAVTVRLYAAAAEAAGTHELTVAVDQHPLPLTQLLEELSGRSRELARVCGQSSCLVNGTRTRAEAGTVRPGDIVDVLPPFAGG
ncbi:MoaD/ThiS family protein [Nesterenkonia alkaliphila]|uniref:Molybdopterin synthase sulfur carrier subunit n=1 Tax=Nesterenkonia alkaliphila TaxID=1463631 RepID=A0A7K1UJL7_9MICC|nr:MoaD/ThiS family protein [Nesterenkonia alkaliphila]MVT26688.1 MoaD/ThiS family protein [Nesterenkonia alkaliphila]GFZ76747.1 hypothetical protein GCM10011359_00930 [Nesterenkonia alkaliphila]